MSRVLGSRGGGGPTERLNFEFKFVAAGVPGVRGRVGGRPGPGHLRPRRPARRGGGPPAVHRAAVAVTRGGDC